ncbi:MAG: hypothetical protein HGA45_41765 [Chloroflexales bacterium]|nr:hypothetical protein [Chloroflexales bacterium]
MDYHDKTRLGYLDPEEPEGADDEPRPHIRLIISILADLHAAGRIDEPESMRTLAESLAERLVSLSQQNIIDALREAGYRTEHRQLLCACCGGWAGRWKQHPNQDIGHGICPRCIQRIRDKGTYSEEEITRIYGIEGVNFEKAKPSDA